MINRFSEDIDITFDEHLGKARRKKVKYQLLKPISELLEMPIENWDHIESDKDYNHYDFSYEPVNGKEMIGLRPFVKLEVALMSYAYPTEKKEITSIIYDCLAEDELEIMQEYGLEPFEIRTQMLCRTFIDKLFAVCDYYMTGKATRNSRHLYDIYRLRAYVTFDVDFQMLVNEVRAQRSLMDIRVAPSAREDVDIFTVACQAMKEGFFSNDYELSTRKLINDDVPYEIVKENYLDVMERVFGGSKY